MIDFLAASIRIATPLLLAALGGILSERAGVFAVGLEGMMLAGAFGGVLGSWLADSAAAGLLGAMLCGAAIGLAVAMVAVRHRADQMVTGLAANILAMGLTSYLLRAFGAGGRAPSIHLAPLGAWPVPCLSELPVLGALLFNQPPLTYLAVSACAAFAWLLQHTQLGLILRACGENPEAVFASGGRPQLVRFLAVVACGAVAGLGGAVLSLQQVGMFTDGMTGGRGYLALAALIVGRWKPWGVALACLVFGSAEAVALRAQTLGLAVNSYVLQMLPYAIALAVLAGLGRSTQLPASIGRPFDPLR